MTSRRPEIRNRRPNSPIALLRMRIDVSRIRDLSLSRRIQAIDLGGCKALELRQTERFAEGIDANVFEEPVSSTAGSRSSSRGLRSFREK